MFDWVYWFRIFSTKQGRSLERWALRYLHSYSHLRWQAKCIRNRNNLHSIVDSISVSSIWIDGTPQAHGFVSKNISVKCELADLLYIIEEQDSKGNKINEQAVLLQAKNTLKYNKLDTASSTKKERMLLEKLDRSKKLTLRTGVNNSSQVIGSYIFGATPHIKKGLSDCTKFLLMPKHKCWHNRTFFHTPFHITWPISETNLMMETGISLFSAVIAMTGIPTIGKSVVDPAICQWSKMVRDLENKYQYIVMTGYNGQNRINKANFSSTHNTINLINNPSEGTYQSSVESENLPYISIIKLIVQYGETK